MPKDPAPPWRKGPIVTPTGSDLTEEPADDDYTSQLPIVPLVKTKLHRVRGPISGATPDSAWTNVAAGGRPVPVAY